MWICFLLGLFAASFRALYADNLPFENNIETMFTWLNSWYYSNTHFKYGGNNFVGIIFRQSGVQLSTPETITINSGNVGMQTIRCSEKLRGIYYNNQRGRRIWPLDTGNLDTLQNSPYSQGWYTGMTMTNGFFTNCTGVPSGGYVPLANEVYGQIDHEIDGQTGFSMYAWLAYNFTGNLISWASFAHTMQILTWGVHSGFIFDNNGGIAQLGMNVPWCQSFDSSPSTSIQSIIIPQGNDMTFTCYGASSSGYRLDIFLSGASSPLYSDNVITNTSSNIFLTWSGLPSGNYLATCTVQWPAWIWPQCGTQIPFTVAWTETTSSWSGCAANFQWEINFVSSFGSTVINSSIGTYYTNSTGILAQLWSTDPIQFVVSGNFLSTPRSWSYAGWWLYNYAVNPITLSNTNAWNYIISTYTTWSCTYTDATKRVYVDTVAPSIPSIISPISSIPVCPSLPLTLSRSWSTDTGGLSHYTYQVYNNSGMVSGLLFSGTQTGTTTNLNNLSSLALWTYYVKVTAVDIVGNTSVASATSFTTSQQYCPSGTGVVIVSPTIWLRNVNLDTIYRSDPIFVLGLTGPTLVSVSKWMLIINNGTGIASTWIITSADTLYIELVSSDEYDTTVSSQITLLGLTGTFSLTTKKSNCTLSVGEKLVIQNIYENLKEEYNNNLSKLSEFLNTFQNMVQDESELTNSCTLEYLLELIETDYGNQWVDTSNHIAPNCKEYTIGYDNDQRAYYAPEMMQRYYFVNRESLIRHIDYYNPGDCHINTYTNNYRPQDTTDPMKHIAPNGKIYHLVGQYGWFSATEFTSSKYFDSLQGIKTYIDLRNPSKEIWNHSLDTTFTPIVYAAPNGREYKIYKTNRWFMSYKLMKVKYYSTLTDLKTYINKNNPSKY